MTDYLLVNTALLGLGIGGLVWYLFESTKERDREKREIEVEHNRFIENLSKTLDFDIIKTLNNNDYSELLRILTTDQAVRINNKKREYEEKISLEAETRRLIEEERRRVDRLRLEQERQSRLADIARRYDLNEIKVLSTYDISEITKYLNENQILIVRAVKDNYDAELRLKRETESLRRETERIKREREQERDQERIANQSIDYNRGYQQGQIDGLKSVHANSDAWSWMFTTIDFRQGYELGYRKSINILKSTPQAPVYIWHSKGDIQTQDAKEVSKEVSKVSSKIDKVAVQLEILSTEVKNLGQDNVPIQPVLNVHVQRDEENEENDENVADEEETDDLVRKLDVLNMMMM